MLAEHNNHNLGHNRMINLVLGPHEARRGGQPADELRPSLSAALVLEGGREVGKARGHEGCIQVRPYLEIQSSLGLVW